MKLGEGSTECGGHRCGDGDVERETIGAVLVLAVAGAELHVHGASTAHVDLDTHVITALGGQGLAGIEAGLCLDGSDHVRESLARAEQGEGEAILAALLPLCDGDVGDLEVKVPIIPHAHLGLGIALAGVGEAQGDLVDHGIESPFLEYGLDRISAEVFVH